MRAEGLCRRLARDAAESPRVAHGVVVHGGLRASLSVAEATVLEVLLGASGAVVPRPQLESAVWPDGPPSTRSLDALLYRLRRRIAAVNIHVATARGLGYTVDTGPLAIDGASSWS
jgi:DNA-binding response OmpR family regulator